MYSHYSNFKKMSVMKKQFIIPGLLVMALMCFSFISFVDDSYYSKANPTLSKNSFNDMKACIDACSNCAAMCNYCSSMCLKEKNVDAMSRCIQLNMECAAVCKAASQLMSLGSEDYKEMCRLCAQICKKCGDECSKHKNMEHCQKCAEACYQAAELCKKM